MPDREKVIKWFEYDYLPRVGAYRKDCKQGCDACVPMHDGDDYCDIDMLCKVLALLKEQKERLGVLERTIEHMPKPVKLLDVFGDNYEKIVRCKDCKYKECEGRDGLIVCDITGESHQPEWLCADGERRDG